MIYLDNGATSYPKPRGMVAAMEECIIKYCGNPGRSGHFMSMKTGEEVYHARRNVAKIFGIEQADRIVFTKVFGEFVRANGAMWAVRPMGSYEFAEDYRSEIMRRLFPWTEAGR